LLAGTLNHPIFRLNKSPLEGIDIRIVVDDHNGYSDRKLFTGFIVAARID